MGVVQPHPPSPKSPPGPAKQEDGVDQCSQVHVFVPEDTANDSCGTVLSHTSSNWWSSAGENDGLKSQDEAVHSLEIQPDDEYGAVAFDSSLMSRCVITKRPSLPRDFIVICGTTPGSYIEMIYKVCQTLSRWTKN